MYPGEHEAALRVLQMPHRLGLPRRRRDRLEVSTGEREQTAPVGEAVVAAAPHAPRVRRRLTSRAGLPRHLAADALRDHRALRRLTADELGSICRR